MSKVFLSVLVPADDVKLVYVILVKRDDVNKFPSKMPADWWVGDECVVGAFSSQSAANAALGNVTGRIICIPEDAIWS